MSSIIRPINMGTMPPDTDTEVPDGARLRIRLRCAELSPYVAAGSAVVGCAISGGIAGAAISIGGAPIVPAVLAAFVGAFALTTGVLYAFETARGVVVNPGALMAPDEAQPLLPGEAQPLP